MMHVREDLKQIYGIFEERERKKWRFFARPHTAAPSKKFQSIESILCETFQMESVSNAVRWNHSNVKCVRVCDEWWDDVFATHKIPLILFKKKKTFSTAYTHSAILQSPHFARHSQPFQTSRFICLPFIRKYDPFSDGKSIIFVLCVPISVHISKQSTHFHQIVLRSMPSMCVQFSRSQTLSQ